MLRRGHIKYEISTECGELELRMARKAKANQNICMQFRLAACLIDLLPSRYALYMHCLAAIAAHIVQ